MTARAHRERAKAAAAEYVAACCPWATGWRVTTARPNLAVGWTHHHAMVAVKMLDGTEKATITVDRAASEEAALSMLMQEMLKRVAAKVVEPDPYEATCCAAFGPPPRGWASWSSIPDGFRQGYAAKRMADGTAPRLTMRAGAVDDADLRALGLATWPTTDELTTAWRETAKRTHPDAGGSAAAFARAKMAYDRLLASAGGTR